LLPVLQKTGGAQWAVAPNVPSNSCGNPGDIQANAAAAKTSTTQKEGMHFTLHLALFT
jgi:hypothetical protein